MLGRQQLPFFDASDDVSSIVLVAAGPLLAGWLVMLRVVGGYAREVFGAGTEEYKRIIRASLLCAGLVGIGCYLTSSLYRAASSSSPSPSGHRSSSWVA